MSDSESVQVDELVGYITSRFDGVDVTTYPPDKPPTAWFFARDAEKHWPNFATIVTTDDHDMEATSMLTERGAYRLNIGVGKQTFERLIDPTTTYDYTAIDVVIPHPTYAKQRWIGIVNPSRGTFETQVKQLLDEAYRLLDRS